LSLASVVGHIETDKKCQSLSVTLGKSAPSHVDDYFKLAKLFPVDGKSLPKGGPCFTAGTVNIIAGVIRNATGGDAVSVSMADITRPNLNSLEPDMWINQAFKLLPDVLSRMADSRTPELPWNDVDLLLKSTIQIAFTATWAAMDQKFNTANSTSEIAVWKKQEVSLVRASVQKERVWIWFALNLLSTLFGALHLILQQNSSRPVVIDTAAVAIMTDASQLLNDEKVGKRLGWKNMSYVTKEDAFAEAEDNMAGKRILLKMETRNNGFVVVKKDH
jgi:hypothetical protein